MEESHVINNNKEVTGNQILSCLDSREQQCPLPLFVPGKQGSEHSLSH